ncbi:uncharacterized protein LOC131642656 [Vicia villosa]|uniref:uncharacterized protein LOC131642656 n=1 Tax=Vicia villosa TaxID=3911 RepID=UPI00273B10F1|nr:uncharacterized protein LOC131642656 [Vicia villosa]
MARPLAKICDINDSKELWKVYVRGGDIHVAVPAPHVSLFSEKMALDHSYTVSNFKVQPNVAAFRPSSHKFMLKFTSSTTVTDDNKTEIPPKPLVFTKFTDIINGNFNKDVLIDVIGMVESIGYSQTTSGARKQQINMMLRDGGENTINCTLWESYAEQFMKFKQERKFPLSVSNTFNVTVLGLNTDLLPMKESIERLHFVRLLEKLKCWWPLRMAGIIVVVMLAHVLRVVKKPPFECEAGHFTEAEIFRYKIEIEVTHVGNSCNFLFWDRECELLLGLSASQLRHTMIKAGIHDPLEFPLALDRMLDRKMAFKIKWQPR